jgi:hypothetical protein
MAANYVATSPADMIQHFQAQTRPGSLWAMDLQYDGQEGYLQGESVGAWHQQASTGINIHAHNACAGIGGAEHKGNGNGAEPVDDPLLPAA